MTLLRRLFARRVGPNLFGASIVQPVLTGVGVFTFLAGVLYLPYLGPTRVEMILALLLLAAVALLCTAVGQLATIIERLDHRADKGHDDGARSAQGN
jgi:drug/metabolite transporter (DMT)-like permease